MLSAYHDADDNGIDPTASVSPDLPDSAAFDPDNDVYFGGDSLDGFVGLVLTAEAINKVAFLTGALLSGALREHDLEGGNPDAAGIYVAFFQRGAESLQNSEGANTGDSGSDSDGDSIVSSTPPPAAAEEPPQRRRRGGSGHSSSSTPWLRRPTASRWTRISQRLRVAACRACS